MKKAHDNLLRLLKREEEWLRRGVKARSPRTKGESRGFLSFERERRDFPNHSENGGGAGEGAKEFQVQTQNKLSKAKTCYFEDRGI